MLTLLLGLMLANQPKLPEAKEIVQQAIQTTLDDRKEFELRNLQYTKTVRVYDTGETPEILAETMSYRMWYEDGESRQQLIEKNGESVENGKVESPGTDAFKRIPERYDFEWSDTPVASFLDCGPCYIIHVKPRKKGFKPKSREEKVQARMEGTLYISKEFQYIRFAASELPKSFRMGFLYAAKVNSASFEFQQRHFGDLVVFDTAIVRASYAFLGKEFNKRYEFTYTDYSFEHEESQTPPQ